MVGEDSFVDILFTDGKDTESITIDMSQTFKEEELETLKAVTHKEIKEIVLGKEKGFKFDYVISGKDGTKLEVEGSIEDINKVTVLDDDEFIKMLKESSEVPSEQKEDLDIEEVRSLFSDHLDEIYRNNKEEEVRSLTFAALRENTEGIHINENEVTNLKGQFITQVQKMAKEEGQTFDEYVVQNFGSNKLMEDYIEASQTARVLQSAIYRRIGAQMKLMPTYNQLEPFVKTFLYKVDPSQEMPEQVEEEMNQQITSILSEPLNRQRIIESWISVKAEDKINQLVGLI